MRLKKQVRLLILEAMKKQNKRARDIVKHTPHNAGYVSNFLKNDSNHSLDALEAIVNAIDCTVHISIVPKPKQPIINH